MKSAATKTLIAKCSVEKCLCSERTIESSSLPKVVTLDEKNPLVEGTGVFTLQQKGNAAIQAHIASGFHTVPPSGVRLRKDIEKVRV